LHVVSNLDIVVKGECGGKPIECIKKYRKMSKKQDECIV